MMKSSCRAGLHRELLSSTSSTFHPVKRISGMHLKPYLKLQKKERSFEISPDSPRSPPMNEQRLAKEEKPRSPKPRFLPNPPLWKPLGNLSSNTRYSRNSNQSHVEGPWVKERRATPPATIHQGEDEEELLDIWAVVKPGNTKEKIAFFAAQLCSDTRVLSMKNKSTWDIDGRATKRRKKSLDIKKAKIHLERMREANGRCYQPEPFACGIEHCSVHNVNDGGEGGFPGRPLSVVEMVAFLEQRASVLLASCTRNCPSASAVPRFAGQPKAAPSASGFFSDFRACELRPEKPPCGSHGVEQQAEPVRVLEMVAKLESECLRRQSEREAGSLSRNSSFRRNVGRVLLASGILPENESDKVSSLVLHQEERSGEEVGWGSKHSGSMEDNLWEGPSSGQSSFDDSLEGNHDLTHGQGTTSVNWYDSQNTTESQPFTYPEVVQTSPHFLYNKSSSIERTPKESLDAPNLNSNVRVSESLNISISVSKIDQNCRKNQSSDTSFVEDSLPGRLFLLLSKCEISQECLQSVETPTEECPAGTQGKEASPADQVCMRSHVSGDCPDVSSENALQILDSSHLKRQRSHDFLETRFKIQQLLEPQQYLVFLPHHIIVKIFGLLPTKSLVALKCTCGYFKFIIEYYNVRPADSRWVRDPRYREDPCKQCKKKYTKGDVSLCRWHPKPYCQALPYGPGYWMCCHRSQKNVPGCKLGLHDNHWVPACHNFNRAIHKKSREIDEDC
ncbi:F-box only protein 34 [Candoia aspera]|uniref:F-box only protein 34 n=1 Tax=Candoia aspera TaxID=51853 RepID=UPI002FD7DF94